jgi:oligoendopeptidase F
LADLTALELWRISLKNPARAQRHFLSLCQAGGSKSYMSLLTDENLPLPIDPDTLKRVAYAGCDALSL